MSEQFIRFVSEDQIDCLADFFNEQQDIMINETSFDIDDSSGLESIPESIEFTI